MLKRILGFVFITWMFFVGVQFVSVYFYAWEFDDFTRDEVKFSPAREEDSREHLVDHIKQAAQYYGLELKDKDIVIQKSTDIGSGITRLAVDVTYTTPVDLYYFTYQLRRHIHAATMY